MGLNKQDKDHLVVRRLRKIMLFLEIVREMSMFYILVVKGLLMTSSLLQVDMNGTENLKRSSTTQSSFGKGLKRSDSFVEEEKHHQKRRHDILACLEEGTEGCITLVGSIDDIDRPIVAFVRMAEAIALPNTIEVILKFGTNYIFCLFR